MKASRTPSWIALLATIFIAQIAVAQTLDLQQANGPHDGLIYDITYGPNQDGTTSGFALTATGVYRLDEADDTWTRLPILPPEDLLTPAVPFRVDAAYLVGDQGLYPPRDTTMFVTAKSVFVHTNLGQVFVAARTGGPWTERSPPTTVADGQRPWHRAARVSASADLPDRNGLLMARSDEWEGVETTRLWRFDAQGGWTHQGLSRRAVLSGVSTPQKSARWRQVSLTTDTTQGEEPHQVEVFLLAQPSSGSPIRFQTIDWRKLLSDLDRDTRRECAQATGLIHASTGLDESPVLFAIGRRTLCASTDGGTRFESRSLPVEPDRVGDFTAAVAFAMKENAVGVRILVATDAAFDADAPKSRAFGGRLFLSDDAGKTWLDATPDIEGPGGFLGLAARTTSDGAQVLLQTGRRGVYRGNNGLGFVRTSKGLNATPIHAITRDPYRTSEVFAAAPTGLYDWRSGYWGRASPMAARSMAIAQPEAEDKGQIWVGSYWGTVLFRSQIGKWSLDALPPRPPGFKALDMTATVGRLPQPIPLTQALRPVSIVAPAGVDESGKDRGYAFVDGEGLYERDFSGTWTQVPLPLDPPFQVAGLVAAPLKEGHGALLLTRQTTADGFRSGAFLHRPGGEWSTVPLAADIAPQAALTGKNHVWMASVTRGLFAIYTKNDTPKVAHVADVWCDVLADTPDGTPACIGTTPLDARGKSGPGTLGTLEYIGDESPLRVRLLATNPVGRAFPAPVAATFTENNLGTWPWVTPGLGVYAPPTAMEAVLPASDDQGLGFWFWLWLAVAGLLAIAAVVGVVFAYGALARFARRADV